MHRGLEALQPLVDVGIAARHPDRIRRHGDRSCGDETQPDTSTVSGCVGLLRKFAKSLRPSPVERARFVRKVSSFFQVV